MRKSKAQSIMEYSIVIGLVFSAFLVMQTYLKRGIQAGIRISADQLGDQEEGTPIVNPYTGVVEEEMPVGRREKSTTQERRIDLAKGRTIKWQEEIERTVPYPEHKDSEGNPAPINDPVEISYWESSPDCKYYDPRDWTLHIDEKCKEQLADRRR